MITLKDVEHVAMLARLQFTDEEKRKIKTDLNNILDYFKKLQELDTEHIEPTSHVIPLSNILREDTVFSSLPASEILKNAPTKEAGYFKVPKVIE